jgi:ABC-type glycerol-3-phosphate transport system permease component
MNEFFSDKRRITFGYWASRGLILVLLLITFLPFLLMLLMSVKESIIISTDLWSIPKRIVWENYTKAFFVLIRPIFNSLFISAVSIIGILIFTALSGYAFGRFTFKGKEVLFLMFIGVMMVPNLLMMVPQFMVINNLHLMGSYLALILPYISGLQLFGVLLARSFFSSLPEEMFEAARIEGAKEIFIFLRIALPLSWPILITVAITSLIAIYNDYVWPMLTLNGETKKTFSQIVVSLTAYGGVDYGMMTAGYVIGSIPLILITRSCLKYYLDGFLEGAVKG